MVEMAVEGLSFRFRWDFGEHSRAVRAIGKHRIGWRVWRVFTRIALVLFVITFLIALLGAITEGVAAVVALWPWAILTVAWVLYVTVGASWITAWQVKRLDPSIYGELSHQVSSEAYLIRGKDVNVDVRWSGVLQLVETEEFFLLFWSKGAAYYLPKRVVSSEIIQRLREAFVSKIGDRARVCGSLTSA